MSHSRMAERIQIEARFGKCCQSCPDEMQEDGMKEPCAGCGPTFRNWRSCRTGHPSDPLITKRTPPVQTEGAMKQ
jgi:hypothetical protein